MTPLVSWLLLKSSAILCVGIAMTWLLVRRSAAARHYVLALSMGAALLLPVLTLVLPAWRVQLLPARPATSVQSTTTGAATRPIVAPSVNANARSQQRATVPAADADSFARVLPYAWLFGLLATLAWMLAGQIGLRLLQRRARVASGAWQTLLNETTSTLGLQRCPTILLGDRIAVPVTWGVIRPKVMLPASAETWPTQKRRVVLLHELAHVARRDAITQWIATLACAVYWFNPCAWYAARRMRVERERACDALVLSTGTRPSEYAALLLDIAMSARHTFGGALAAMAMARPSQLEGRLLAILSRTASHDAARRGSASVTAAAALLIAPLAAVMPTRVQPDAQNPQEPQRVLINLPSGRIQLSEVKAGGVLRTGQGDIYIGTAAGPLELNTGAGDIRVESLTGTLTATTSDGNVTVMAFRDQRAGSRDITIETRKGSVTLLLPEKFAGELDLEARGSGELLSDFPLDVKSTTDQSVRVQRSRTAVGSSGMHVRVVATNGGIVVRRTNQR